VTGCLKNSKIEEVYVLAGIASSLATRRSVQADWKRTKIMKDNRHPIHEVEANNFRPKSRNSFLENFTTSEQEKAMKWTNQINDKKNRPLSNHYH